MNTIFTIGYEGTDIAQFLSTLSSERIQLLADVRAIAISRKKGFSKNALRHSLSQAGIEYQHFVDLGDPKEGREAARAGRFAQFHKVYSNHLGSPSAQAALSQLIDASTQFRTCLMCFEREPASCHRTLVAEAMSQHGIMIANLFSRLDLHNAGISKKLPSGNFDQSNSTGQQEIR